MDATTRLLRTVAELRRVDPEMPIHHLEAFLRIATQEGAPQRVIAEQIGVSKSAIQRTFDKLSERFGVGLITVSENPHDRREKVARLTPQGVALLRSLARHLDGR